MVDVSQIVQSATADELGRVMVRATAPVFLLSAVASFISVLMSRLARIVDRIRAINKIDATDTARLFLKADLPRLKRRAGLLHTSILLSLLSGIATTMIVAFMFGGAFLAIVHEWGAAILFVAALLLFAASLSFFAFDLRISLSDSDNFE